MADKFEKYYHDQKQTLLFRSDLSKEDSELSWLRNETIAEQLEYLDRWSIVESDDLFGQDAVQSALNNARQQAHNYVTTITGFTNKESANSQKATMNRWITELVEKTNVLKRHQFLLVIFRNRHDLKDSVALMELLKALDSKIDGYQMQVVEVTKAFGETANNAKVAFETILSESALYKEKAKETFEKSAEYFHNQGLTAFGHAFGGEATVAETNAANAADKAKTVINVTLAFIAIVIAVDVAGFIKGDDIVSLWKWLSVRVAGLAILVWFMGYYLRERRNFQHVAVANRHRQNLCNAYVALSERMTPEERRRYLDVILPHLSALGKTGFITKEDMPDMPGTQLVKTAFEATRKSGG
jgi:hypothetical protein